MTTNEDGPKNFFLPKSKSKKFTPKHVKKCKLSFGIGLRQNFWEPDLRSYPAGSFNGKIVFVVVIDNSYYKKNLIESFFLTICIEMCRNSIR